MIHTQLEMISNASNDIENCIDLKFKLENNQKLVKYSKTMEKPGKTTERCTRNDSKNAHE